MSEASLQTLGWKPEAVGHSQRTLTRGIQPFADKHKCEKPKFDNHLKDWKMRILKLVKYAVFGTDQIGGYLLYTSKAL